MPNENKLKPGEYVLYENSGRHELGRVKEVMPDGQHARIWFSEGETAALTPLDTLVRFQNAGSVIETSLGGAEARRMFPAPKEYIVLVKRSAFTGDIYIKDPVTTVGKKSQYGDIYLGRYRTDDPERLKQEAAGTARCAPEHIALVALS